MEISDLIPHIESLVFASDKPLTSLEITDLINAAFGFMEEKVSLDQIDASIKGIVEKYQSEFYPFEVKQSGGGWQFLTKKEFHKTVAQLNGEKFLKRLSSAALETLAIVAYKQPVTKGEIESIRGVSSDYAIQKLLEKELVIITGRNEKLPGHPLVYATSKTFMDYFGINTPEDLPKIREVLAEQLIQPTVINHTDFEPADAVPENSENELMIGDDAALTENETSGEESIGKTPEENEEVAGKTVDGTETLEDEIAKEEAISDAIFVAEDEAIAEIEIENSPEATFLQELSINNEAMPSPDAEGPKH